MISIHDLSEIETNTIKCNTNIILYASTFGDPSNWDEIKITFFASYQIIIVHVGKPENNRTNGPRHAHVFVVNENIRVKKVPKIKKK